MLEIVEPGNKTTRTKQKEIKAKTRNSLCLRTSCLKYIGRCRTTHGTVNAGHGHIGALACIYLGTYC